MAEIVCIGLYTLLVSFDLLNIAEVVFCNITGDGKDLFVDAVNDRIVVGEEDLDAPSKNTWFYTNNISCTVRVEGIVVVFLKAGNMVFIYR